MRAAVQAKAAGEEAIAIGDVDKILRACAGRDKLAGTDILPDFQVVLRIARDDLFSRRSTRRLDANHLLHGNRHHTVWICVAQVALISKRELVKIVHRTDIVRRYAFSSISAR